MAPGSRPVYWQVPQHDDDNDSEHGGPSPAPSTSPMPLLSPARTLTPLSMSSYHANEEEQNKEQDKEEEETVVHSIDLDAHFPPPSSSHSKEPACASNPPPATAAALEPCSGRSRQEYEQQQQQQQKPVAPGHAQSLATAPAETCSSSLPHPRKPTRGFSLGPPPPPAERARSATAASHCPPPLDRPRPLLRTASAHNLSLRHPAPDITLPNSSRANNIAQLEATAERLSMTSSIEDAIRHLYHEQKLFDSRRNSIRAASLASAADPFEPQYPLNRQVSGSSSILEINNAARQGGYSPSGYVMSPANSIRSTTTRFWTGPTGLYKTTSLDMEEANTTLSRHSPGKGSVHSVRSAGKPPGLTNIAETEPTTLTQEAMDAADKLDELPLDDITTLPIPPLEQTDLTPIAHRFDDAKANEYWDQAVADARSQTTQGTREDDARSLYAGSIGTFEQAERAFADFDGTHASPDADHDDMPFMPSFEQVQQSHVSFMMPQNHNLHMDEGGDTAPPVRRPQPQGAHVARPKSYLDPETGNTMLYYPARVPMMLNVPQKLSKKPKAEVRNQRRTQVLSDMAEGNRQSAMAWLPELQNEPLGDTIPGHADAGAIPRSGTDATITDAAVVEAPLTSPRLDQPGEDQPMLRENPPSVSEEARKSEFSISGNVDKRKSRMSAMGMLPPQLRASAFFDMPSETTNLQVKDGSATVTLDSILDASVSAPVSAFTDHAFAGALGSEVYGLEKKRKSQLNRLSTGDALGPTPRQSQMHLRKPSALSRLSQVAESIRSGSLKSRDDRTDERTRLSESIDGRRVDASGEALSDEDEKEEGEEEEEQVYNGPPTTLLAELQIRKQQQKLRTRVAAQAYPQGMHSTLLELDTVAEIERNARKNKKINLAWEASKPGNNDESDDEDLPLGLLLATKSQGNLAAAVAELNRPMGLMERREMEENEPLSQRRTRLLGPNAAPLRQQRSMASVGHERNASGMLRPSTSRLDLHTPEEEENEEETLGARRRRLQAREKSDSSLPEARPVSAAFSAELLTAFKGEETETSSKGKDSVQQPTEEEETLGQRRRRLQAEREAREKEMGASGMPGAPASHEPATMRLAKKHSMADVLGAYGNRVVSDDPRTVAERMKQAEGQRYKQDQEQKLAAYRNQLPTNLSTPNLQAPGGFMSGRFNDGTGGGLGQPRASMVFHNEPQQPVGGNPYLMNAFAPPLNTPMQQGYAASQPGYGVQGYGNPGFLPQGFVAPMMNPYGMPMQPQPMDRVEQWRQSVWQ